LIDKENPETAISASFLIVLAYFS